MKILIILLLLCSSTALAQKKPVQVFPFKQFNNNSRDTVIVITKGKYMADSVYLARFQSDYLSLNYDYERCQKAIDLYKTDLTQGLQKQQKHNESLTKSLSQVQTQVAESNNRYKALEKKVKVNQTLTVSFGIATLAVVTASLLK
jgi:hypothetical protein